MAKSSSLKNKMLHVRVSQETLDQLEEIADRLEISQSEVIRKLVNFEWDEDRLAKVEAFDRLDRLYKAMNQ